MRNRIHRIQFRLNENEASKFNMTVKRSGLSRETYLRHLINDLVPSDIPPPDYYNMMNELRAIHTTLKQLSQSAHTLGTRTGRACLNVPGVEVCDEAIAILQKAIVTITNTVLLPRRMERKNE